MGARISSYGNPAIQAAVNSIRNGAATPIPYTVFTGGRQDILIRGEPEPTGELQLRILKRNAETGAPLAGARFSVTGPGGFSAAGTSNANGMLSIQIPTPGGEFTVTEESPPPGFLLSDPVTQTVTVNAQNPVGEVVFNNPRYGNGNGDDEKEFRVDVEVEVSTHTTIRSSSEIEFGYARGQLVIRKQNQNHDPLSGAVFDIRIDFSCGTVRHYQGFTVDNGARLFTWNHPSGNIDAARVTVTEVRAPQHYAIDAIPVRTVYVEPSYTQWTIVTYWEETVFTYFYRWTVIEIRNGVESVVEYWQEENTRMEQSGWNVQSHAYDRVGDLHRDVLFVNQRIPGQLIINKVCSVTNNPLPQARFRVERITDTGISLIGVFTTNANGKIVIENVEDGRFRITEAAPPPGFLVDRAVHEVTIAPGQGYELIITNTPRAPILIRKVDPQGNPLLGAEFTVKTMNGQHVATVQSAHTGYAIVPNVGPGWYIVSEVRSPAGHILSNTPQTVEVFADGRPALVTFVNHRYPILYIAKVDAADGRPLIGATFRITEANGRFVGEHTTGPDGLITLTDLPPGAYVVSEIRASDGYILDMTPQTVELRAGQTARLEFRNTAVPGMQLIKLCSVSGRPVEGAMFDVTQLQGGFKRSLGVFTTGVNGIFFIPDLAPGHYVISEVRAAPGFILDPAPRNIFVEGGRINVVTFYNTPYSNLRLLKICAADRTPLEGAVFRLFDERRREIGAFTTSALGEIFLTQLPGGTYFLQEVRAPAGYLLDNTVRQVDLVCGQTTVIEVANRELGSVRILKRCSESGTPLYGVVFLLYDSRNNLLGEFRTDQNGMIVLGRNLAAGTYRLREIRSAPGFVLDETLRTITVREGETTEVVIENDPIRGQIQITKRAAAYNDITKEREGALLQGAVFEIFNNRNEVVDRIETDRRGVATSRLLPVGVYGVREIAAPRHYILNDEVFYAEIKLHNDLIQFEVRNQPADLSVTVQKYGNFEAIAGQTIRYDFRNIANTSTVPLDDFYFRDAIPTDAVRLVSISTGTWNERLTYRVMYATNQRRDYRVLADRLDSRTINEIDARREAVGLRHGEYITSIKFEFGTVQPGFREVTPPFIICTVNGGLPNEYRFTNRVDVGGRSEGEWVIARDAWVTIVYGTGGRGRLPQTGADWFS